ncbi:Protein of unknown function [Pyronema omphalodes CBS 100304]|uniref:Uncharacterized protein n=1 Tax=Pyronema omphalodes (strain CBS 100304) TaxID=1076935 RepID=U4LVW2_PYROM|nr:Protein of unknown function [Pyronema omphalodes CBS 100304]
MVFLWLVRWWLSVMSLVARLGWLVSKAVAVSGVARVCHRVGFLCHLGTDQRVVSQLPVASGRSGPVGGECAISGE